MTAAMAWCVHSQESEGNGWHLVAMSSSAGLQWFSPATCSPCKQEAPHCPRSLEQRKMFLWWSHPLPQASSCTLSAVGPGSPALSGCLHIANPSPLPGTDFWSLNLSAQALSKYLSCGVLGDGGSLSACPPQSSCCASL